MLAVWSGSEGGVDALAWTAGRRVGANPESGVIWRSLEGQFSWVHYGRGSSPWNGGF